MTIEGEEKSLVSSTTTTPPPTAVAGSAYDDPHRDNHRYPIVVDGRVMNHTTVLSSSTSTAPVIRLGGDDDKEDNFAHHHRHPFHHHHDEMSPLMSNTSGGSATVIHRHISMEGDTNDDKGFMKHPTTVAKNTMLFLSSLGRYWYTIYLQLLNTNRTAGDGNNPTTTTTNNNNNTNNSNEIATNLIREKSLHDVSSYQRRKFVLYGLLITSITLLVIVRTSNRYWRFSTSDEYHNTTTKFRTIHNPIEKYITVDRIDGVDIQLWYRVWGNMEQGIPLLFVHGGPGNAIEDYDDGNDRFFDYTIFYVIEIDQRGTGQSLPSVRNSSTNMKYYTTISIDTICNDFELIRQNENIDKWIVWGGSYGSTISLNYGTRYPHRSLGLLLRGIYLDTQPEIESVYSQQTYFNNSQRLAEFTILYNYAVSNYTTVMKKYNKSFDDSTISAAIFDPNNAEILLRRYNDMITVGDEYAIWHWHVFENNLMEELPENLLDPYVIEPMESYREALSVSFFETTLWIRGTYSPTEATNLLSRIDQLQYLNRNSDDDSNNNTNTNFTNSSNNTNNIWICQGLRDEVCPAQYTRLLTDAFDKSNIPYEVNYIDAGHEDTDPVMAQCLKTIIQQFTRSHEAYQRQQQQQQQP